ncbi:uncharacterized protein LOC118644783 [Monomorium pharaonis]|uniref:uncharacterized protein LOC118644783 n=1 Tax=Monomorium pharaonis TaxID=307658 RepID=UPI001746860B|nr:uncharacterized protein LOC118644783 [Monomorium pharaonis]
MLYDHWNDARIVFDCSFQLVLLTTFIAKLMNEFLNHDKASLDIILSSLFPKCYFNKILFLFVLNYFYNCYNGQILRLFETMDNHWNVFTSKSELRILKDYTNISRKFTIFYSIIMYSMLTIFLLIPLTPIFLDIIRPLNKSRPRLFAVVVELRIDQEKYYAPIFCYNIGIIVLGAIIMVAVDTTFVVYTAHACSLFSIISQQFEEILPKLNIMKRDNKRYLNEDFKLLSEKEIYQQYIICLKKYQLALE